MLVLTYEFLTCYKIQRWRQWGGYHKYEKSTDIYITKHFRILKIIQLFALERTFSGSAVQISRKKCFFWVKGGPALHETESERIDATHTPANHTYQPFGFRLQTDWRARKTSLLFKWQSAWQRTGSVRRKKVLPPPLTALGHLHGYLHPINIQETVF